MLNIPYQWFMWYMYISIGSWLKASFNIHSSCPRYFCLMFVFPCSQTGHGIVAAGICWIKYSIISKYPFEQTRNVNIVHENVTCIEKIV